MEHRWRRPCDAGRYATDNQREAFSTIRRYDSSDKGMANTGIDKPQRMIGIRVAITRCIDDSQWPSFIECQFVDAHGKTHRFTEKSAIVTADNVISTTPFPYPAIIACEIVERSTTTGDKSAYVVNTELPWHVSSTEDRTRFDVLVGDLVEWEFGGSEHRPWTEVA